MGIRDSKEYKEMTFSGMTILTYTEAKSEEHQLAFWQKMVDTGMAWKFDGWYGRTAMALIEDGVIEPALVI